MTHRRDLRALMCKSICTKVFGTYVQFRALTCRLLCMSISSKLPSETLMCIMCRGVAPRTYIEYIYLLYIYILTSILPYTCILARVYPLGLTCLCADGSRRDSRPRVCVRGCQNVLHIMHISTKVISLVKNQEMLNAQKVCTKAPIARKSPTGTRKLVFCQKHYR